MLSSTLSVFTAAQPAANGNGEAAGAINIAARMDGFDAYMEKVLKDWNAPGIAVGVVQNDKLVS